VCIELLKYRYRYGKKNKELSIHETLLDGSGAALGKVIRDNTEIIGRK
jgi:hypothetical protein